MPTGCKVVRDFARSYPCLVMTPSSPVWMLRMSFGLLLGLRRLINTDGARHVELLLVLLEREVLGIAIFQRVRGEFLYVSCLFGRMTSRLVTAVMVMSLVMPSFYIEKSWSSKLCFTMWRTWNQSLITPRGDCPFCMRLERPNVLLRSGFERPRTDGRCSSEVRGLFRGSGCHAETITRWWHAERSKTCDNSEEDNHRRYERLETCS